MMNDDSIVSLSKHMIGLHEQRNSHYDSNYVTFYSFILLIIFYIIYTITLEENP
jgi:hypothetical protein